MVEAIKQSLIQSGLYNEANALKGHADKFKEFAVATQRVQLNRGADLTLINQGSMSLNHINLMPLVVN